MTASNTFAAWDVNIQEVRLEGDYNGNGIVGTEDYAVWLDNMGDYGNARRCSLAMAPPQATLLGVPDGSGRPVGLPVVAR